MTLVPVPLDACPTCAGILRRLTVEQPAIVRHGGHGATERTRSLWCAVCTWSLVVERTEVRP